MSQSMRVPPPVSCEVLLERAAQLRGASLAQLAATFGLIVPSSSRSAKGFAGQLVERALGASAGSAPVADFESIGVELKTLPLDARGRPRESTFVTTLDLDEPGARDWRRSRLRQKLARVLWMPVHGELGNVGARTLGRAVLWSPDAAQEAVLREDFEALVELIDSGLGHRATGHVGQVLQLRPKGANARALSWTLDEEGAPTRAAPRAFYLRASFTAAIVGVESV